MVKTRVGIFETNSSSTHCLSLGDISYEQSIPDANYQETITLGDGEYGWQQDFYDSWLDKADYISLILHYVDDDEDYENLNNMVGIVRQAILRKYPNANIEFNFSGYVDHGSEYFEPWMKDVDEVFKFIFGNGSFETDNDNY